jgi:hypothetical protein
MHTQNRPVGGQAYASRGHKLNRYASVLTYVYSIIRSNGNTDLWWTEEADLQITPLRRHCQEVFLAFVPSTLSMLSKQ